MCVGGGGGLKKQKSKKRKLVDYKVDLVHSFFKTKDQM